MARSRDSTGRAAGRCRGRTPDSSNSRSTIRLRGRGGRSSLAGARLRRDMEGARIRARRLLAGRGRTRAALRATWDGRAAGTGFRGTARRRRGIARSRVTAGLALRGIAAGRPRPITAVSGDSITVGRARTRVRSAATPRADPTLSAVEGAMRRASVEGILRASGVAATPAGLAEATLRRIALAGEGIREAAGTQVAVTRVAAMAITEGPGT